MDAVQLAGNCLVPVLFVIFCSCVSRDISWTVASIRHDDSSLYGIDQVDPDLELMVTELLKVKLVRVCICTLNTILSVSECVTFTWLTTPSHAVRCYVKGLPGSLSTGLCRKIILLLQCLWYHLLPYSHAWYWRTAVLRFAVLLSPGYTVELVGDQSHSWLPLGHGLTRKT